MSCGGPSVGNRGTGVAGVVSVEVVVDWVVKEVLDEPPEDDAVFFFFLVVLDVWEGLAARR